MAVEFPHVDFVNIDIAPMVTHTPRANVIYEVYNVSNGIDEPSASFDFVHAHDSLTIVRHSHKSFSPTLSYTYFGSRFLHMSNATQMRNYEEFLPEIYRVLRPGGMFLFHEFEYIPYESHNPSQLPSLSALHSLAVGLVLQTALEQQSISIHGTTQMADWLARLGDFSSINKEWRGVPASAWHPDPRLQDVGMMAAQTTKSGHHNLRSLLKCSRLDDKTIDELLEGVVRDAQNPLLQLIFKYHVVYAFKA